MSAPAVMQPCTGQLASSQRLANTALQARPSLLPTMAVRSAFKTSKCSNLQRRLGQTKYSVRRIPIAWHPPISLYCKVFKTVANSATPIRQHSKSNSMVCILPGFLTASDPIHVDTASKVCCNNPELRCLGPGKHEEGFSSPNHTLNHTTTKRPLSRLSCF